MQKNTVQKLAARQKSRRTKLLTADSKISAFEQPQTFLPQYVYFVKNSSVSLVVKQTALSQAPHHSVGEEVAMYLTPNAELYRRMLEFLATNNVYDLETQDFTDVMAFLRFIKKMTGYKVLIVSDLDYKLFGSDFEVCSEVEYFSFELRAYCVCYFCVAGIAVSEYLSRLCDRLLRVHYRPVPVLPLPGEDKYAALTRIVSANVRRRLTIIVSSHINNVVEQLMKRGVDSRAIKELEFLDRPYTSIADYELVITRFLYEASISRPCISRVHLCVCAADFLDSLNALAFLSVFDWEKQLFGAMLRTNDVLEMELLRYMANRAKASAMPIYIHYRAYPTNDQVAEDRSLLELRNRQLKREDADFPALRARGVAVSGVAGHVTYGAFNISSEVGDGFVCEFLEQKMHQLASELEEALMTSVFPRFPSELNDAYRSEVVALCCGRYASDMLQLKEIAEQVNAEANDSVAFILEYLSEDSRVLRKLGAINQSRQFTAHTCCPADAGHQGSQYTTHSQ